MYWAPTVCIPLPADTEMSKPASFLEESNGGRALPRTKACTARSGHMQGDVRASKEGTGNAPGAERLKHGGRGLPQRAWNVWGGHPKMGDKQEQRPVLAKQIQGPKSHSGGWSLEGRKDREDDARGKGPALGRWGGTSF